MEIALKMNAFFRITINRDSYSFAIYRLMLGVGIDPLTK